MTTDNNSPLNIGGDNPSMPEAFFDESKLFDSNEGTGDEGNEAPKEGDNQPDGNVNPDDDFIKISRKDLQAELQRLLENDKEFAQVYSRDVGNKAAKKYKPEIDLLKKNNEALTTLVKQAEYAKLDQEEVTRKFATDPAFAEDYGKVIHAKPELVQTVPDEVYAQQLGNALSQTMGFAKRVLTDEQFTQLQEDASTGKFDLDETGEMIGLSNWQDAVENLQNHISTLVKQPVTQAPAPIVETKPIVRGSDTATPDLSGGGSRGTQRQTYTMTEVRAMDVFKKMELFPGENGIEDAISQGIIKLEGI